MSRIGRRLCSSFLVHLPHQGRQDPLCQGPYGYSLLSEELGLLSLVQGRYNLPDTSMWIFNTCESERTTGFSAALFLAFASPCAWTDKNTFSPSAISLPPPLPAFHYPWMNGFCNSSYCILWTCYFCCFSVKHIYWMWEVKEYLSYSWPLPLK